jgi:hypothetical protein
MDMTVLDRLEQHLDHLPDLLPDRLPDQVTGRLHDLAGRAGQASAAVGHAAAQVPAHLPDRLVDLVPAGVAAHLPHALGGRTTRSSRRTVLIVVVIAAVGAAVVGTVLARRRSTDPSSRSARSRRPTDVANGDTPRPGDARLVDA